MASKADIRRLIKKGLSGKEAGRLVLQDSWEVDHGREGFLSDSDLQLIKNGLKTPQDIKDYNDLIHTYRLIDYTLMESQIRALTIQVNLRVLSEMTQRYLLDFWIEQKRLMSPVVMTQKQYEEVKAKQREDLLQELHDIWGILDSRARRIAPEGYSEEELEQYVQLAAGQLLELVQAGRLEPTKLQSKDINRLEALEDKLDEWRASKPLEKRRSEKAWAKFEKLHAEKSEFLLQAFQRARAAQAQENLESLRGNLKKVRDGLLALPAGDTTFDYWYSSGEELYATGLPEWIEWIDEYKYNLTNAGFGGIAILINPKPSDLDERGYYVENLFHDISMIRRMEAHYEERGEPSLPERLQVGAEKVEEDVREFLGSLAVIETISRLLKLDFTEDIEKGYKEVKRLVEGYNDLITDTHDKFHYLPEDIELSPIPIAKLKPTSESLRYLRERMAISLGEDWWKEGVLKLTFEQPEEELEGEEEEEAQHG